MRYAELKGLLNRAYRAKVPTILWGPPGVGKTAMILDLARDLGVPCETPMVLDPLDIALPVVVDGGHKLSPAESIRRIIALGEAGGILFFDELTTKPPAVQAAILRTIQTGEIGDYRLPEQVWRVAAANPPEQAADGYALEPPMANRLLHLEFQVDPEWWAAWATTQSRSHARIAAFIQTRPGLLFKYPQSRADAGRAWPSPRTWDMFGRLVDFEKDPTDVIYQLAVGTVGRGAAEEFLAWYQTLDLPRPEEILADPEGAPIPERGDQIHAVLTEVVYMTTQHPSQHWKACWRYVVRVSEKRADAALPAVRTLVDFMKDRRGLQLPEFVMPLAAKILTAVSRS
jgi:hypothetical protein